MAPSSKLAALAFVVVVVTATLQPAAAARVQGFEQEVMAEPSSKTFTFANGGAQQTPTLPGFPGLPGAPPLLGLPSIPGFQFPFPMPLFPIPGGPGSPGSSAPPSAGGGSPGAPPHPLPALPGFSFPLIIPGLPFPIPIPFFFPPSLPIPGSSPATPGAPPSPSSSLPGINFPPLPNLPPLPTHPNPLGSGSQPSPPQPTQCMTPLLSVLPCADYLTNATVLTPPSTCCDGFRSLITTAPICLCHGMNGDLNSFLPKPIDPMKMMMLPLTCGALPPLQTLFMCNSVS
ncbi:hypothetical protein GUJ93_ZPchr0008g13372 [Zizania palustris]|uniref:Bifunctional inhibitor/plant lipid transfer protein/seed storage helical domain-containing protein n=1 Tax=Zizania palustris TaxID=103762 RepID=A0A8J5VJ19_ZIZPA|nr:hypothetical protein GUJ93_ZPchr0008g13372 [Zizania palustris]